MIRGLHGLFYSSDAEATRAFMRDALKLPFSDIGEGWLIFDFREGDLGVHPIDHGGKPGDHDVSFYCDDIKGTVADLKKRGVKFKHAPQDHGYGWVTYFTMPGGISVQLYEPKYSKKAGAATKAPAAKKAPAKKTTAAKKAPAKKTTSAKKKTSAKNSARR